MLDVALFSLMAWFLFLYLGLGYLLSFGEGQANTPMVFVTILMLTVVGGIAYLAVILVERRVLHYMPTRAITGF